MVQHEYTLADATQVRISGMGEPMLTYLAGLFNGENAVCSYISPATNAKSPSKFPWQSIPSKKMLWQNFKNLSGDDGSSTMTVTPNTDNAPRSTANFDN